MTAVAEAVAAPRAGGAYSDPESDAYRFKWETIAEHALARNKLTDPRVNADGFYFCPASADYACNFIEQYCTHVEGEWAGSRFILSDWQRYIVRQLFGWRSLADGTRRYKELRLWVPRKNGKTAFAAAIGLFLLVADGEGRPQVWSAAVNKNQAKIVWTVAKTMIMQDKRLSRWCETRKVSIDCKINNGFFHAMSKDAEDKDGLNAHGRIYDETHRWKNGEVAELLDTSIAARRQPMCIKISTVGQDETDDSYWAGDWREALAVAAGERVIDFLFIAIWAADPEAMREEDERRQHAARDDPDRAVEDWSPTWTDETLWSAVNPGYPIAPKSGFFHDEATSRRGNSEKIAWFLRYMLNVPMHVESLFFDVAFWDRCPAELDLAELAGRRCWVGVDLSATTDLTALAFVFPLAEVNQDGFVERAGEYAVLWKIYVPEETVREHERTDQAPYAKWVREGWITETPGGVVDYRMLLDDVDDASELYEVEKIVLDMWNATQFNNELEDRGYETRAFRQGAFSYNEPMKGLRDVIRRAELWHGGNPCARWMFANVVAETDSNENVKPVKKRCRTRIDGACAAIMGYADAALEAGEADSVYSETQGFMTL